MKKKLRKEEFRLGQIHGRLQAKDKHSEAQIQRVVFLSQKIRLWRTMHEQADIRLFGYEVPLKTGCHRGECVDIIGYDKDCNLYIFELKQKKYSKNTIEIKNQILSYANAVRTIKKSLEEAFEKEFHLPIEFRDIKSVLLAPKEFYKDKDLTQYKNYGIECAYFRDSKIQKRKPGDTYITHVSLVKT